MGADKCDAYMCTRGVAAVMILVKVVNGAMPPSKPSQWGIFGYLWAPYACSIKKPARRRKFDTSLFAINEPSGVPGICTDS